MFEMSLKTKISHYKGRPLNSLILQILNICWYFIYVFTYKQHVYCAYTCLNNLDLLLHHISGRNVTSTVWEHNEILLTVLQVDRRTLPTTIRHSGQEKVLRYIAFAMCILFLFLELQISYVFFGFLQVNDQYAHARTEFQPVCYQQMVRHSQ